MRLVVAMMAAGLVAGCQAPGPQVPPPISTTQDLRCQMQARSATAGIRSGIAAGFEQGAITRQCRELAVRENMEAVGQRLGFRLRDDIRLTQDQRAAVGGMAEGCGAAEAMALQALATNEAAEWQRGRAAGRQATEAECAFVRMGAAVMAQQVMR